MEQQDGFDPNTITVPAGNSNEESRIHRIFGLASMMVQIVAENAVGALESAIIERAAKRSL